MKSQMIPSPDYFKNLPNPFAKKDLPKRKPRVEKEPTRQQEHFKSTKHLREWLEAHGEAEACHHLEQSGEDRCDPWKYEPILLNELYRVKTQSEIDSEEINHLRELIRAGSWMTYERKDERSTISELGAVREREQADWLWKIRNADPDTAKEHADNRDQILAEIDRVERELHLGKIGDRLEGATTSIESLLAGAWYELKKAIALHGLTWDEVKTHPATKALVQEIEALRPVRDLMYYRRLYPMHARSVKEHLDESLK